MNVRTATVETLRPALYCISRLHGLRVGGDRSLLPRRLSIGVFALLALTSATAHAQGQKPPPPASPPAVVAPAAPTTVPQTAATQSDPTIFRDPASGVEVNTNLDSTMFPSAWLTPDIAAEALPLASTERDRAIRIMKVALSKYPPDVLRQNLERIYMVGGLKFDGIQAAGTNSRDRLYIKIEAGNPLYTDTFIEESFHHEFGHMLQRNYLYQWDADSWMHCNPPDFQYRPTDGGVQAVREGHSSLRPSDDWNRRGFLSEYAASDESEDFATIAGALLDSPPAFWLGLERFPALKTKIDVAIAFYGKIDPSFTAKYFQTLRPGVAYIPPPVGDTTPTPPVTPIVTPTPPGTTPPAAPGTPAAKP